MPSNLSTTCRHVTWKARCLVGIQSRESHETLSAISSCDDSAHSTCGVLSTGSVHAQLLQNVGLRSF